MLNLGNTLILSRDDHGSLHQLLHQIVVLRRVWGRAGIRIPVPALLVHSEHGHDHLLHVVVWKQKNISGLIWKVLISIPDSYQWWIKLCFNEFRLISDDELLLFIWMLILTFNWMLKYASEKETETAVVLDAFCGQHLKNHLLFRLFNTVDSIYSI